MKAEGLHGAPEAVPTSLTREAEGERVGWVLGTEFATGC